MKNNNDLINDIEFVETHNIWLSALFSSIKKELKEGRTYQAEKLAEIGHYLADDNQYHIEEQIKGFRK